ncbi:uncharacterized protein LOC119181505 [Rhipicephalus microplus]|uniref:uncharacterized protein LOC119181505 n=1 Tax=Rhipicephalus microplus TaxID=6941 RepID=UPI0018887D7E|nr:uncharacterized protein LOC119181505 [Rhipicephalus microplus]
MATTVGKLPEFQQEDGNFEVYLERFEVFAAANDIAEDKKLPIFLTAIGENAYVTLRSLLLPKTLAKTAFTEVVDVLKKHYAPKRSVVTERYRFYQRKQEPHETVAEFIVELKKLAATCEFGAFLTEALRDRLVAGIRTEGVRCRLLAMPDEEVTWERACSVAMAMEAATQDTKEMLQTSSKGAAVETEDIYWQQKISQPSKAPSREAPTQSSWDKENGAAKEQTKRMCHRCGGQHSPEPSVPVSDPGQVLPWSASRPAESVPLECFLKNSVSSLPVALVPTDGGAIRLSETEVFQEELRNISGHLLDISEVLIEMCELRWGTCRIKSSGRQLQVLPM